MNDLLTNFKNNLTSLNYQLATITKLEHCLQEFLERHPHPENTTSSELKAYHNYLQNRPHKRKIGGLSESHIYSHMYSLRLFYVYLQQVEIIQENPINSLKLTSPQHQPRAIFSQEEIKQLYKATKNHQERAMLSLFYGCGLRRSEGEKLDVNDVDFKKGLLYVRAGKGMKRRVVPMSEKLHEYLQKYLEIERDKTAPTTAFMTNKVGLRMRGQSYATQFKKLKERAGITKQASLHNLRHSIATHLLEEGLAVEKVKEFLGHQLLETTQVYTQVSSIDV